MRPQKPWVLPHDVHDVRRDDCLWRIKLLENFAFFYTFQFHHLIVFAFLLFTQPQQVFDHCDKESFLILEREIRILNLPDENRPLHAWSLKLNQSPSRGCSSSSKTIRCRSPACEGKLRQCGRFWSLMRDIIILKQSLPHIFPKPHSFYIQSNVCKNGSKAGQQISSKECLACWRQ